MNKGNWLLIAAFGVIVLLIFGLGIGFLFPGWGCCGGAIGGWGMMGPGMMGGWGGSVRGGWGVFGWLFALIGLLIPLTFLAVLALGGIWLFRQISGSRDLPTASERNVSGKTCPSCGRPVQVDWQNCPYCGESLV